MKKAGMVLGIVGGAIAIVLSILIVFGIVIAGSFISQGGIPQELMEEAQDQMRENTDFDFSPGFMPNMFNAGINFGFGIAIFLGIIGLVGGILGLVGGILIEKKNVLSGVFMCVGAVLTIFLFVPFVLLVIGCIFAFINKKPDTIQPV